MDDLLSSELSGAVMSKLDISSFYSKYVEDFKIGVNCVCPIHNDENPSFRVNHDGSFKCFSGACQASKGGRSPIGFYQIYKGLSSFFEAQRELYSDYVERIVPADTIKKYRQGFRGRGDVLKRLRKERGWRPEIITAFELGFVSRGDLVSIPVQNRFGFYTTLLLYNVFGTEGYPKLAALEKGMPQGRIWPLGVVRNPHTRELLMCEGQSDTLLALSLGLSAFTLGSCSHDLTPADAQELKGKVVYVLYDMDEGGTRGARRVAERLALSDIKCKVVEPPFVERDKHNDLTDWIVKEGHTRGDLKEIISRTEYYVISKPITIESRERVATAKDDIRYVPLRDIRRSEMFNRFFRTEATVMGKEEKTLLCPKVLKLTCKKANKKGCAAAGCPMALDPNNNHYIRVKHDDPLLMHMVEESHRNITKVAKDLAGCKANCKVDVSIEQTYALTKVLVTETLSGGGKNSEPVQVSGLFHGVNVTVNAPYLMTGYVTTSPKDGTHMAVFTDGTMLAGALDKFKVDDGIKEVLMPFRPPEDKELFDYLMEMYDHMSETVTHIRGRPLLHMACDLVFHSPVSFMFNNEYQRKGSIECIVFGDERCGKGKIAEGLHNFYQHGEVVNAENTSFMNLVGGIKMIPGYRGIAWGRLAMHHRGTVIIDEMNAMHPDVIGSLSRIRSEGYAEISKDGVHGRTNAICGLIWIGNPRDKRSMSEHNVGLSALRNLVPKREDQARFDYAIAVALDEVDPLIINQPRETNGDCSFTPEQCHALILWVKSRKEDQIVFNPDATQLILDETIRMHKTYTNDVPLVMAENFRFKLAKVASAIAGRIWNTDITGETLVVDTRCVEAAVRFFEEVYECDALGYRFWSDMVRRYSIKDAELVLGAIEKKAKEGGVSRREFMEQLIRHEYLTEQDIRAILNLDSWAVAELIHVLTAQNCIMRKHNFYVKTHEFNDLLRKHVRKEQGRLYDVQ
jgi:hypothetical protein